MKEKNKEQVQDCAVAYTEDIVIITETNNNLKKTALVEGRKRNGLKINETKTKYMVISRQNHNTNYLKVNDYKFESVRNLKYLGADINEEANSHEKVKKRLIAANR